MRRRTPRADLIIGTHEAGHFVAARRFGVPVVRVTVNPEQDEGGIVLGHVKFRSGDKDPPSLAHRMLVIALAGPIAQRKIAPRSPVRKNGSSDFAFAALHSETASSSPMAAGALRRWAGLEATTLVEREWPLIQHVAALLIEHRTIEGDKLERMLAPHTQACEAAVAAYRKTINQSPEAVQSLLDEHAAQWRRMRKVRRSDVAQAMTRVMLDVLALGDNIELSKIKAATIYNLVIRGFDEDLAREKVEALVAARAPFVGWTPVTVRGQAVGDGQAGGEPEDAPTPPANLLHHQDGGEYAHLHA